MSLEEEEATWTNGFFSDESGPGLRKGKWVEIVMREIATVVERKNSPFPYKMKIHLELHLMSSLCLLSVDDVYEQYWLAAECLMVHKIKPRLSAALRLPSGSHVVKACWEYKFQTDNQDEDSGLDSALAPLGPMELFQCNSAQKITPRARSSQVRGWIVECLLALIRCMNRTTEGGRHVLWVKMSQGFSPQQAMSSFLRRKMKWFPERTQQTFKVLGAQLHACWRNQALYTIPSHSSAQVPYFIRRFESHQDEERNLNVRSCLVAR
ncbi:unnamed protein product [Caretta caretta]